MKFKKGDLLILKDGDTIYMSQITNTNSLGEYTLYDLAAWFNDGTDVSAALLSEEWKYDEITEYNVEYMKFLLHYDYNLTRQEVKKLYPEYFL